MPEVTVAIPAYKAEHLGQAIASVLSQTFIDFELLISDDCPDETVRAVIGQFGDPRIRRVEGPRRGLVANSVHLWESARCDFLKYVYDDDFLLPFCLDELVQLLRRDSRLTYAFCSRHVVDGEGRLISSPKIFAGEGPAVFMPEAVMETIVGDIRNPVGEPTNILIRRSRFADSSCLHSYAGVPIRHHIDLAFFLNACEAGPSIGTEAFGAAFRRHANQATSLQTAPGFSYGVAEWEIFIRGAVSHGMVRPDVALRSFERLELHYGNYRATFPEIETLARALPQLRAALERGERNLLGADFRAQLAMIDAAIDARQALA
jgi:glycosyltransferase involved in cell wall biosynthesis